MEEFYLFGSKLVSTTFHASPQGLNIKGENVRNDHKLIKGDYSGIDFPIIFQQGSYGGSKLYDILDTGFARLYLISDNMKNILLENKLTGWQTYSIMLFDRKHNRIDGYNGFSVTGKCGPIYYKKNTLFEKRHMPTTPLFNCYKGEYFDDKTWDGTDFFTPQNSLAIIITSKSAKILNNTKITNIRLHNLLELETPEYGILDKKLIK